jgi:hypothetical protein
MDLVRKLIAITGAPMCWTEAVRTSENAVEAKFPEDSLPDVH